VRAMGARSLPSLPVLGLLVSTLATAALVPACGPSLDAAARADLDRRLAQIPVSEETFPPSETFLPMAFVVGQWTEHRLTDEKGRVSLVTYKLVGQDSGGYWLETVTESYQGREAVKLLVALLSGRDPAGMEIRAIRIKKGNGAPVDVDAGALLEVRARYRGALDLLAMTVDTQDKDDMRVPAGHFIGCYKVATPGPWGPWAMPATLCAHPSVPLSGVVRATPVGKGGLMELVSFGVTGAESEF
jgi:hypothetical protein